MGIDHNIADRIYIGGAYRHTQAYESSVHRIQGDAKYIYSNEQRKVFQYRFRAQFSYDEQDMFTSNWIRNKISFNIIDHGKYLHPYLDVELFLRIGVFNLKNVSSVQQVQRATLGNEFQFSFNIT